MLHVLFDEILSARKIACGSDNIINSFISKEDRVRQCSYNSFIHSFVRLFIRSFFRSFIRSFVYSFVPLFLRSFVRLFVHLFRSNPY